MNFQLVSHIKYFNNDTMQQRVKLFYENRRLVKNIYRKVHEAVNILVLVETPLNKLQKYFSKVEKYTQIGRLQENTYFVRGSVVEGNQTSHFLRPILD